MTTSTYLSSEDKAWAACVNYVSVVSLGVSQASYNAYLRAAFYSGIAGMPYDYNSDLHSEHTDTAWEVGARWAASDFPAACAALAEYVADPY